MTRNDRSLSASIGRRAAVLAAAALAGCNGEVAPPPEAPVATPEALAFAWPTLDGEPPMVIAHRGASGERPEHTLEAYQLALEQGADAIEPDLVVTRDGVLVARHDRYLSTTTDVRDRPEFADRRRPDPAADGEGREDWWVEDFTLDEIKSLRARQPRSGRSAEFDGAFEIPTFAETLVLATVHAQEAGRPVGVYPETKDPAYYQSIGLDFITPLTIALEGYDAGLVHIQSFDAGILRRLEGQTTAYRVFLTDDAAAVAPAALDAIGAFADGVGVAKSLAFDGAGCPTGLVEAAHARGLFVHAWTFWDDDAAALRPDARNCVADAEPANSEYEAAFAAGVDGVFADFPATAVAARERFED